MRRFVQALLSLLALTCAGCSAAQTEGAEANMTTATSKELIVLAAPRAGDTYYEAVADDIVAFQIDYARSVAEHDDVLILTDEAFYPDYVASLGAEHVVIAPQEDIWARDFGPSNAARPTLFRYTAAGQGGGRTGQNAADDVQEVLAEWLEEAGLSFDETDLLNDGGNFVDDYAGRVVVSRKFLRDNDLSETAGRDALIEATGATHVAFIEADEQGGLEHADGVVAFVDPNVLVINSYPEDPDYADQLQQDLRAALPGVSIHEITTPYDGSAIYDGRFGSACGLYTNMLVTPERIYLPQFGIPEDAEALAAVRSWTTKTVVPIQSDQVCQMGGGVRCMSWQLRGQNAERLKQWASAQAQPD